MQIGQKIKKLRVLKNYTQDYMANNLEISQSAYCKIETGETELSYKKLEKIADIFKLRPEDIVSFNENIVFNIMNNQTINGVHNSHLYFIPEEYKKIQEEQINSLKTEIIYLKTILGKLLLKK